MVDHTEHAPIAVSTAPLKDHPILLDHLKCWQTVLAEKMLPTKSDYIGAMINYPDMVPNLVLIEPTPTGEMHYTYFGSVIVDTNRTDPTHENFLTRYDPAVTDFMASWSKTILKQPCCLSWQVRTRLPDGSIGHTDNYSVLLTGSDGIASCITTATEHDDVILNVVKTGGYLVGSEGIDLQPIDIGYGVPDLPRQIG